MGIQLAGVLFARRRRFCKRSPLGSFLRNGFVKQVIWDMLANNIHIMFAISYISERVLWVRYETRGMSLAVGLRPLFLKIYVVLRRSTVSAASSFDPTKEPKWAGNQVSRTLLYSSRFLEGLRPPALGLPCPPLVRPILGHTWPSVWQFG